MDAYSHAVGAMDSERLQEVAEATSSDAPTLVDLGDGTLRQVVGAHQLDDTYGAIVLELGKEVEPELRSRTQRPLP